LDGLFFQSFTDPALNGAGAVAFLSRLRRSETKAKAQVLYTNVGGSLIPAVLVGSAVPGLIGAKLSRVIAFQLLDDAMLFHGELTGVPAIGAFVLCSWTPSGGVQVLLRTGTDLGGRMVKAITALTPAAASTGQSRYASPSAAALARVNFTDGTQAVVEVDAGGVRVIARTADVAPDGPADAEWKGFGVPAVNRNGDAAFLATLAVGRGGVERGNDTAIFVEIDGAPFVAVAREGQILDGVTLNHFFDPVHNSGGDVAALVTVRGNGVGRGTDKALLFASKNNAPQLLVRTGGELPGVPGAKLKAFRTIALPDDLGPAFVGTLAPRSGGVSSSNDTGLWALDSNGTLQLLVREGETIEVGGASKTLKNFTVLALVPVSPNQTRAFNSARQIAYRANFIDGSEAVLCVQVP
jgi:hypothetical protein